MTSIDIYKSAIKFSVWDCAAILVSSGDWKDSVKEVCITLEKKLKFRDDGTFVIVQFSDMEFIDDEDHDPETIETIIHLVQF